MLDDNRVRAIGDLGVHPNLRMGACVPRGRVLAYDMLALWFSRSVECSALRLNCVLPTIRVPCRSRLRRAAVLSRNELTAVAGLGSSASLLGADGARVAVVRRCVRDGAFAGVVTACVTAARASLLRWRVWLSWLRANRGARFRVSCVRDVCVVCCSR
jgi:hypothetical protein